MFGTVFIKSVVYAGLLSKILAIVACLLFREWKAVLDETLTFVVWVVTYLFHKKLGTW
jgi:hypothetical protein